MKYIIVIGIVLVAIMLENCEKGIIEDPEVKEDTSGVIFVYDTNHIDTVIVITDDTTNN
jgi:hypothetical protein